MASTTSPQLSESDLAGALRRRGQRVTSQRLVIHRALREMGRHVTAEQVLDAVVPRLPGISLPTVYATLDLFEELGLVHRVPGAPGAVLYDPRTDPHHHMVCERCGAVEDLEARVDLAASTRAARRRGFQPEGSQVVIRGLCAGCRRDG